uniref:EF-hand domain-containing protein n=1 Tax=Monodelphis domestica TaxID=13616 RepID=F6TJL8_MONDO
MSHLLSSILSIIEVYYKYTSQDQDCNTLCKRELKKLLENEFRPILKNPDDPDTVEIFMQMLDRDHDKKVDFIEFLLMIFKLTMACNQSIGKEYCQASGSQKQHPHHHRQEQSKTKEEEEEEETDSSNSSWSAGEEPRSHTGRSKKIRHRSKSNSRGHGKLDRSSSSGYKDIFGRKQHESKPRHSKRSENMENRSSSSDLEKMRPKSSISPSRIYGGEKHEFSSDWSGSSGRKIRVYSSEGLSYGIKSMGYGSNSTQSKESKGSL